MKCGAPFFLGAINFIINNREGESVTKPNMGLVDDYAHNVVESLLLRINEEFFTSSDLKVGTHIRLDSVFRRNERKELKSTTSVALHIAAECWLSLRASVRTIETIKIRQSMQSHVMTTDFGRRLVRCIEQLVSSSKLLVFGGLSHFNFTCVLAINQQLHLCMLLQNGERLMASPVAPLYAGLDDTISPRLYMKFSNMSSAKDSPATEPNARLFISAFDEKRQRSLSDKTVVEKYIHQPVCVKSSIKKKKFSKLFSVNKVDYIAFDTDRKSAFAGFSRDRLVKRIHIEEDSAIDAVVRLTLEDPVGNVNEQSQLEILLDEIEVATLRKKSVQSQPPFEFGFLSSPPAERKKNSIGSYAIPVSKKNVFNDKVPVIDEYARSLRQNKCDEASMLTREKIIPTNYPVHVKMPMNNEVNNEEAGIEKMQITANRRLISHLDSLYATLRYIIGLVSMEEKIPNSNADNGAIVGQCCMNKKKIDATYAYFMQNRGNVHCQKTILENTIDLLDDVSRISMELISQKKYNTYEKVRQLLMGSLCATDNQLQFCG